MRFRNREQAAILLAARLEAYRGQHPLVLGIARRGMTMAGVVAQRLGADLDAILVQKLRMAVDLDFGVGAIDENGRVYLAAFAKDVGLDPEELEKEERYELAVLKRRRRHYKSAGNPIPIAGRTVIVVDDGVATASTAIAALRAVRAAGPAKIVLAVGVACRETLDRLRSETDELLCLHTPAEFGPVGDHYVEFTDVSDDDVVKILLEARERMAQPALARA